MKLAWKEIMYSKKKYFLIELILILLIFMVLFLSGLANGLGRAVSATIANMPADSFILSSDSQEMLALSNVTAEQMESMNDENGIETAGFSIFRSTVHNNVSDEKENIIYFGMDAEQFISPNVTEGQELTDSTHEIVLDSSFKSNGMQVGDIIKDSVTDYEFTIVGFTKDAMYSHVAVGFISSESFEEMRQIAVPGFQMTYNAVAVKDENIINMEELEQGNMSLFTSDEVIENLPGYKAEQMTIQMILWVLVVISAVILGIFFYILTLQKQSQFGVLKAIGMKMSEINGMMIAQILMLSVCGAVIGNVLAFLMAAFLPEAMPFYLEVPSALMVSCVFVCISLMFGLFSTRYVAKVDPLMVIGGADHE